MRCYLYEIPENVKWSLVKEKKLVVSLGLEGSSGRSKTKGLFRKFRKFIYTKVCNDLLYIFIVNWLPKSR